MSSSSPSASADYRIRIVSEQREEKEIQYKQKLKEMEQQNGGIATIEQKFGKPESSHFEVLIQETVGLVSLEEFVKKRDHIVGGTYDQQRRTEMEKKREENRLNRKSKVVKTQLSFDMEEEDENYATEESKKEKKQVICVLIEEAKEVGDKIEKIIFKEPKSKKQKIG